MISPKTTSAFKSWCWSSITIILYMYAWYFIFEKFLQVCLLLVNLRSICSNFVHFMYWIDTSDYLFANAKFNGVFGLDTPIAAYSCPGVLQVVSDGIWMITYSKSSLLPIDMPWDLRIVTVMWIRSGIVETEQHFFSQCSVTTGIGICYWFVMRKHFIFFGIVWLLNWAMMYAGNDMSCWFSQLLFS